MGYSIVQVEEIDPAGPGGVVRFVRRELGVEAFGINWFELPPNATGNEHDEGETGQEEVNVIIRGSGAYWVDGKEVSVTRGHVPALRSRHDTRSGRGAGGDDVHRRRRTPRQLRAKGAVLNHTIEVNEDELRLLQSALHAYLDDFGHEEADVLREIKELLAKLPTAGVPDD